MIYDIEVAGPVGFQVSVVCGQPASRWPVADFVSLARPRKRSLTLCTSSTPRRHTLGQPCANRVAAGATSWVHVAAAQPPVETSG